MALQSSFYPVDGRSRTYPQTKHIATKQHAAVYSRLVGTNDWDRLSANAWNLINNSVVLDEPFSISVYDQIEVRIADEVDELTDSISDISIVASISADIITVAGIDTEVTTLAGINVALSSLYADKIKLDSLYADKAKLDSLYADKAKLDSIYADKAKLDSIYADKIGLDAIYVNLAEILLADDNAAAAAASASSASTSASNASTSASNAATSASNASTSETNAATSATNAATSASNSLTSEQKAQKWAEELENIEVEIGKYSALHWAAKSAASASAASTSETNAGTSETNAANSASAAATSATNAETSETNAANSASAAATSATNAETAWDNFDDKYLGAKASDPTLDNDGDPLQDGAIYWNTTAKSFKAYNLGDTTWYALTSGIAEILEDLTPQLGGDLDFNGKTANNSAVRGIADASLGTGTHTFDYANGDMQQLTATGAITVAFSNLPTGDVAAFIVDAVNWGAFTITHPVGMLFAAGTAPTYTAAGTDRLLVTKDKDNVYTLTVIAQDIKAA